MDICRYKNIHDLSKIDNDATFTKSYSIYEVKYGNNNSKLKY
jgi:hypothetical protein